MARRLLHNVSLFILLLLFILAGMWPMVANTCASEPYPPMVPGQSSGSVTGRVTTNASVAMPGVPVYIVNASDSSIRYIDSTTDSNGYFTFAGVNATNGSAVYRILAISPGYNNATSSAFSVSSGTTSTLNVIMTRNYSLATPTPVPAPGPGDIVGYVRIENTTTGIINARVSLVKADNPFVNLISAVTDSSGHFRFSGVEYLGNPGYELRVEKYGYDERFSTPFMIVSDSTVTKDIYLSPTVPVNPSQEATVTPEPGTPTAKPSGTPTPQANSGLPGFEIVAALAGVTIAYALLKKK